jgi:uncharacterized protein YceK
MRKMMVSLAIGCLFVVMAGCSSHNKAATPAPATAVPESQVATQLMTTMNQAAAPTPAKPPASTPVATAQHPSSPPAAATKQPPSPETANALAVYSSREYHVSLRYPSDWKQSSLYSEPMYEGSDGFFELAAMDGAGVAIDQAAEIDAHHVLKPFGANPSIETLEIAGQEARLIKPSDDQQQTSQKNLSELIVRYPEVVQIGGNNYCYFILWSDKSHIDSIAKTIKFLN